MNEKLKEKLSYFTNEELSVMASDYHLPSYAEPAFANMKLRRSDYLWNVIGTGRMIAAKPHTRFVDIPIHSHSYIEMMHVCEGSVTHFIEGKTVVLDAGQILIMNRHTKHSVSASGVGDLAVNLIVSSDFLTHSASRFSNSKPLCDLMLQDQNQNGESRYLVWNVSSSGQADNLMENLIASAIFEPLTPQIILTDTLSLIFRYFEMFESSLLLHNSDENDSDKFSRTVTDYIQTCYRTSSLSQLSEQLNLTPQYVSKLIKDTFGSSFTDLIREKRFSEAEQLLSSSNLSVAEIATAVGYENIGFFHRRFKSQYGISPAKWRKLHRKNGDFIIDTEKNFDNDID